jgi:ABC-type multidrug transport system fused ATPase/permease subunit
MNFDRCANRIYGEKDGRSISITLSGIVGLTIYLLWRDWVMAVFVTIIVFPLFRIIASALHARWEETHKQKLQSVEAQKVFQKFSPEEKEVIKAFVDAGGSVLTWSQVNRTNLSVSAIESFVQRGLLFSKVVSDGFGEAFALKPEVFDMGQQASPKQQSLQSTDDVPF